MRSQHLENNLARHVPVRPAADVKRLLAAKPKVLGLAVPGMVMGSPGMEGGTAQPYKVLLFDKAGKTRVFASH